jgi:hypothetical protein
MLLSHKRFAPRRSMRVYVGWLQPPQPLVVRRSALRVRRPLDRL